MTEVAGLFDRLSTQSEIGLASFTSEELVVVGADSPLEGLVTSERLAAMGPVPLTAALGSALRSLVARGFVDPGDAALSIAAAPAVTTSGAEEVAWQDEHLELPLRGDLSIVVALRRAPAFIGLVAAPRPAELSGIGTTRARTTRILHGFAAGTAGPLGVLEERRSPLGIHDFALRTVASEAAALADLLLSELIAPSGPLQPGPAGLATVIELVLPEAGSGLPLDQASLHRRVVLGVRAGGQEASLSLGDGRGIAAEQTVALSDLPERFADALLSLWHGSAEGRLEHRAVGDK